MHKMMLVVSLKTAEGTLCMVLHSIAQHTISMVLHSIVQYGIAWLSLSRQRKGLQWPQRGPNVLLTKPRNKKIRRRKTVEGTLVATLPQQRGPNACPGFLAYETHRKTGKQQMLLSSHQSSLSAKSSFKAVVAILFYCFHCR